MSAVLPTQSDEIISYDPATGEVVGRVPAVPEAEVRNTVERAREAFSEWKKTSFAERSRLVMKAREVILAEMDAIARLISDESGKPVAEALSMEIAPVLDLMQHFARQTEKLLKPARINISPSMNFLPRSSQVGRGSGAFSIRFRTMPII